METYYLVIILLYRARASEPQVNSRYQLIVDSEVGLLLEIDQYYCEKLLYCKVPIPSMN